MQSDDAISMLMTMASMQEEHNAQVHPQWKEQGYEYYRAIWVECAEMLDHFGWKWWKNQEPDIDQEKLELVDIWHFALSELIRSEQLHESLGAELANAEPIDSTPEIFRKAIESLAISSLQSRSFKMSDFTYAMRTLPMDLKELFALYVGKTVLNRFRQDHGYKEGSYRKLWAGREDNEHLIEILESISVEPEESFDTLYQQLEQRYSQEA